MTSYGGYHVLLREADIEVRSSLFEENGFTFLERQKGSRVPPGHRAPWQARGRLAVAKLHARIRATTPAASFGGILLDQGAAHGTSDFIEVHVYGPIHRRAIVSVQGPVPSDEVDSFLWKRIKHSLAAVGATVREI